MFRSLVSHNEDIRRLVEKGYAIGFDSEYLIVRDIPYLDQNKNLQIGAFVSKLVFVDKYRVKLQNHEIFFCGSHPHQIDGTQIRNLGGGPVGLPLSAPDLVVERSFSNKPQNDFRDLFEKIESYVTLIAGPAMNLFSVNPYTFRVSEEITESVFNYQDTLTSLAELGDLSANFKEEVVAIIGLGGTGSYVLDFLSKTPIKEIRCFDADDYHVHNAFRSPGRMDETDFGKSKAEVYGDRYSTFRKGILMYQKFVQGDSTEDLDGVTFVFVCVDSGPSRLEIFDLLFKMKIPFIDVGMGLDRATGPIGGMLRAVYYSPEEGNEEEVKRSVPLSDAPGNEYRTNIQIAELNALNACFAVIKYKQIRGYFSSDGNWKNLLFTVKDLHAVTQ